MYFSDMISRLLTLLGAIALIGSVATAQPCPSPDAAGPYDAGWRTVTVQRGNRTLDCRLYYPASTAGRNTAVLTGSGIAPFPMVAFGHGFFMQTSYYISYYEHLASHGYITIAPQFPDTQHDELALDLIACLDELRRAGTDPAHFLHGAVDTAKAAVSGHSMGGGASLLAASHDSRILVAAPMCPAETTPSVIGRMRQIAGAVCIIAGSADGITPVSVHQQPMYNASLPFKSLAVLQGGNHTRCMDVSAFDWTDPNGAMTRAQQQALTRRFMTAAFDYHLKADTCGGSYSYGVNAPHADVQLSFVTGPSWPVELASFTARRAGAAVLLRWTTESESENYGFEVQRSRDGREYRAIGFVPGAGSSTKRRRYAHTDHTRERSWYRLRQIDFDGASTLSHAVRVEALPSTPAVYPTVLRAGIPSTLHVTGASGLRRYTIIDAAGRVTADGELSSGSGRASPDTPPSSSAQRSSDELLPGDGDASIRMINAAALKAGMHFLILHSDGRPLVYVLMVG